MRSALAGLIRNFEADTEANRKQIKDLSDCSQELFYAASMELLNTPGDSRGTQVLVSFLAANGMLLRALSNPDLSRDDAISLARTAHRFDPEIGVSLARTLADGTVGSGSIRVEAPARLMDILGEVADAGRIVPSLMRMMRHPDPYLRSKAVKMIGRGSHSAKWVMGRLSESDPRVRANAIESIWGVDTPEARTLLNFAASDANNRVVGNALLGLYYLGESAILSEVVKLASHESALFRSTAAWVMGETGDARFTEALRRMIAESDPTVRKRAFCSLAQLKAANSQPPVGEVWHLAVSMLADDTSKGQKRLMLAVAGNDIREKIRITPLQFLLSEGNQHVVNYRITEKQVPDAISVAFVLPRSRETAGGTFFEGVLNCLRWKRQSDLWSILPYADSEALLPRVPDPPIFTANAETLANSLRETATKLDSTDFWTGFWRAVTLGGGQSRSRRHVIILSGAEEERIPERGLLTQLEEGGPISVQVIRCGPNSVLEDFCRRTGISQQCGTEADIVHLIQQAYLKRLARYEIAWQPVSDGSAPLKVRVQTPAGWGETVIAQATEHHAES